MWFIGTKALIDLSGMSEKTDWMLPFRACRKEHSDCINCIGNPHYDVLHKTLAILLASVKVTIGRERQSFGVSFLDGISSDLKHCDANNALL